MRPTLPTAVAWTAALGALALCWSTASDARACLEGLPNFAWRGAPLRAAAFDDPALAGPAAVEREEPPPARVDGAFELGLARFAFDDYDAPELRADPTPLTADAYPEPIRAFDGEEVVVTGYAQPLAFEDGRVTLLRLSRFAPGCCFGALPQYDEWIAVDLGDRGAASYDPYAELRVRGRLEVGEAFDELGVLESLYRLSRAAVVD